MDVTYDLMKGFDADAKNEAGEFMRKLYEGRELRMSPIRNMTRFSSINSNSSNT